VALLLPHEFTSSALNLRLPDEFEAVLIQVRFLESIIPFEFICFFTFACSPFPQYKSSEFTAVGMLQKHV
jgi:hypothetical protein